MARLESIICCGVAFIFSITLITYFTTELAWATITPQARVSRERVLTFNSRYNKTALLGSNPFDATVIEQRLSELYPYHEDFQSIIPKYIFQMWKDLNFPYKNMFGKWDEINPDFEHKFKTNDEIIELVRCEFSETVPEVIEALELLPSMILKSDYSRYILLFMYGGTYADLDTIPELPMDQWFDTNRNVGFVCGLEEDVNAWNWRSRSPKRHQIQNWFFKSKARHPILRKLIASVVKTTFEAVQNGKSANYNTKGKESGNTQNILSWTGPMLMTDTVFSYLNALKNPSIIDTNIHRFNEGKTLWGPDIPPGIGIHWKTVTGIDGPILFNDVVLYPFYTTRGPPGKDPKRNYYLTHKFSGSWKKKFIFF